MYHLGSTTRLAPRLLESATKLNPAEAARLALERVRKLISAYAPGMVCDPVRLRAALGSALPDAEAEGERLFALGFLHWLQENPAAAEPVLEEAGRRAKEANRTATLAEAAYWLARVRLLLQRPTALPEFESVLRTLGGSPQATAWFVDLLWRAGRSDRAEQVWKSVRGNRRVTACDEGSLLEARFLLRRGEVVPAERLLAEASPNGGVTAVERLLLLAWAQASQRQHERARRTVAQASQMPYPLTALEHWRALLAARAEPEATEEGPSPSPLLRDFLRGQQARLAGRSADAEAAYQAALTLAVAQPFARYALVCMGRDNPAALLASQPGLFLAVRCRARSACERFRRREISAAELLDALQPASRAGFRDGVAEHFRRLALSMEQEPTLVELETVALDLRDGATPENRNTFRVALERVLRLPAAPSRDLLLEWARWPEVLAADELRLPVARTLLRWLFREWAGGAALDGREEDVLRAVAELAPEEPLLTLARVRALPGPVLSAIGEEPAVLRMWRALHELDAAEGPSEPERWRDRVRELRGQARLKPLAQALLTLEAARRGDDEALADLLDELDAWRGFPSAPPRSVLQALTHRAPHLITNPVRRQRLERWLKLWDPAALGTDGNALAVQAGLEPAQADAAPPAGVATAAWLLHQAARALARDDAVVALAFVRRGLAAPDLDTVASADSARAALPEIERRARAQQLAAVFGQNRVAPALLVDAVDLLGATAEGLAVLAAAENGAHEHARTLLAALADQPNLSPRLAHHLALIEQRSARMHEDNGDTEEAEACWRRAWSCWLRFLAGPEGPTDEGRDVLLDHLFGQHRQQLGDLLARGAVDRARQHWGLIHGLPGRATGSETLAQMLGERVRRFREELATDYLLTTRHAMRYGAIPEGWRADYDKGLVYLRRLLSLDRDNIRLLTALVEICNEWFLDLYNSSDVTRLAEQVERFTPFARQLARRTEDRPGDLAARAALADFYKFRGFLASGHDQKVALYREALRFNPANGNVRELLADLGESVEPEPSAGENRETDQPL